MAEIKERLDLVGGAYRNLPVKQKIFYTGIAFGLILIISLGVIGVFAAKLNTKNKDLDKKFELLNEIYNLKEEYEIQEAQRKLESEKLIAQGNLSLFTFLHELSQKQGIDVEMKNRNAAKTGDDIQESAVDINIRNIALEELLNFMKSIEFNEYVIKIKKLRINQRFDNNERWEVNMTVFTFKHAKA